MRVHRTQAERTRAGFSLIEMMTVIVIILILMGFLITRMVGMREAVQVNATRVFLTGHLRAAIAEYEQEFGDAPPSSWDERWGPQPNDLNLGSEILFASLWSEAFQTGLDEEQRANTDGDQTQKVLTTIGGKELYELPDEWGNPVAYFHNSSYGRSDRYVSFGTETGEEEERIVKALQDPETKGYFNPRGYQLISAGEDGIFATEDDLTNFERRK